MDVTTPEQARIAEAAGACGRYGAQRIPADIRAHGGVARMSDPTMIKGIVEAVSIPVMAKCRIGHFAEAQILQAIDIDYIDESKCSRRLTTPTTSTRPSSPSPSSAAPEGPRRGPCAALPRAPRMITQGRAGHRRRRAGRAPHAPDEPEIRRIQNLRDDELFEAAKRLRVPVELVSDA